MPNDWISVTGVGSKTASTTISASLTETNMFSEALPNGHLNTVGANIRFRARGVLSTGTSPKDFTFRIKIGGTTVLSFAFSTTALADDLVNIPWYLSADITVRVAGATGQVQADGMLFLDDAAGSTNVITGASTNTTALDVTGAKTLDFTIQLGSTQAAHAATTRICQINDGGLF